jgi:hypothetical protein
MITRHPLALALNPALLLVAQGLTPDPWQQELLVSPARHVLLNCSRQAGKSRTVSALALHAALFHPASLTLLVSASLRQSVELFRKVVEGYTAVADRSDRDRFAKRVGSSQTTLELENRSRVVSLPGREQTIRSFGGVGLLIIDEAARVPDDLYASVRPMLAVSRGRLICLSTPFGKRGFFWREWSRSSLGDLGDPSESGWQRIQIPWQQCPRIAPDFIEQERLSLGDSWVSQEYCCSFESMAGLVYPDFESQCRIERVASADPHAGHGMQQTGPASPPHPPGKALGGIDFGYRNPFCALWGFLDRDDVLTITHERYVRGVPIQEHARHLPKNVLWYADPAGAQESATLRVLGFAVRRGHNDIRAGIAAVRARLETGRLRVVGPACPNLLAEARLYRYPPSQAGQTETEIPVDENNHALAALRYLISRIDAHRFKTGVRGQESGVRGQETTDH